MKTSQYDTADRKAIKRVQRTAAWQAASAAARTQREALEAKLRAQREVIAKLRAKLEQLASLPARSTSWQRPSPCGLIGIETRNERVLTRRKATNVPTQSTV